MSRCCDIQELLDAFADNELLSSEAAVVLRHLEACSSCKALLEDVLTLKRTIRDLPRPSVPPGLGARVLRELKRGMSPSPKKRSQLRRWSFAVGVATMLVAVVVAWWSGFFLIGHPMYSSMVADHRRPLSPEAPTDILTDDGEALGRWLRGHASFPVPSSLISRTKLTLVGGRVLRIGGEEIASVRYRGEGEQASLYVMKAHNSVPVSARRLMVGGVPLFIDSYGSYNIVMWHEGGVLVCAVSTLGRDSMVELVLEAHTERSLKV